MAAPVERPAEEPAAAAPPPRRIIAPSLPDLPPDQARPARPVASVPPAAPRTPAVSSMPKARVPPPPLPRVYLARDSGQLARVCQAVESATVLLAGVSPEFARGITAALRRVVGPNTEIYPIGMYYFIVREAGLKRDSFTAASNLAAAQSNGAILRLKDLPGVESSL